MTLRVERELTGVELRIAQKLDRQIATLESGSDLGPVFDKGELRELQLLGQEDYLAYLKRTRLSLGQPESLSEE